MAYTRYKPYSPQFWLLTWWFQSCFFSDNGRCHGGIWYRFWLHRPLHLLAGCSPEVRLEWLVKSLEGWKRKEKEE